MDSGKKFGLYVVRPQDIGEEETRYLITPGYSLLYTQNDPPKDSIPVKDMALLTKTAVNWLREQVNDIRREYLKENEKAVLAELSAYHAALAEELERARARETGKEA